MTGKAIGFLVCSLFLSKASACNDSIPLPHLTRRARDNSAKLNDPIVNDLTIRNNWYDVTDSGRQYLMPDGNSIPDFGACGTYYTVYLQGVHPKTVDLPKGEERAYTACLRSYISTSCVTTYNIKLRQCNGIIQYYLRTTERNSAYCFDPQDLHSFPAPADVQLGEISTKPYLKHSRMEINGFEINSPYVEFECGFSHVQEYFYLVQWYINDELFVEYGPFEGLTLDPFRLTEQKLLNANITMGFYVKCGVAVSRSALGIKTTMEFSNDFFAGIKWDNLTVYISKSSPSDLTFQITAPIGCHYREKLAIPCSVDLHMFYPNPNAKCTNEMQSLKQCGTEITTFKTHSDWDPNKSYSIQVVTREVYNTGEYILYFKMDKKTEHLLWKEYQPESILVIVQDAVDYKKKYCYSHVDPHYKTTDGRYHNYYEVGEYVLYKNTEYNIEVQEKTRKCNRNQATCACAVAIRAGADVVMFDICDDRGFIGFKQCSEGGILRIQEMSSRKYRVHTPIGTYVEVLILSRYNGGLNVNIYASPKDFEKTVGFCGSFDNDKSNDFITESSEGIDAFHSSWKVDDTGESLFGDNLRDLNIWVQENKLFCECESVTDSMSKTTCAKNQYEDCDVVNEKTTVFCGKVGRRKRSVNKNKRLLPRRMKLADEVLNTERLKRSTDVNVTDDEARSTCTEVIESTVVAFSFTELLDNGEIEEKSISVYNDLSFAQVHVELLNSLVMFLISNDPEYRAGNEQKILNFLRQACPYNCSNHGLCTGEGICQCDDMYFGDDCSNNARDMLTIKGVEGEGICDINEDSCGCFDVYTDNLLGTFFCRSQSIVEYVDGTRDEFQVETFSGYQFSVFEGECCFPTARRRRSMDQDVFVTQYVIAISNDGVTFSDNVTIFVYDTSCQEQQIDVFGSTTIVLKTGYCFIESSCKAEDAGDPEDGCSYCNSSTNAFAWTSSCQNASTSLSTLSPSTSISTDSSSTSMSTNSASTLMSTNSASTSLSTNSASPSKSTNSDLIIIIGVVIGAVLFIVVAIGAFVFYKKKAVKLPVNVTHENETGSTPRGEHTGMNVNDKQTRDKGDNARTEFTLKTVKGPTRPTTPFGGRESDIQANFLASGLKIYWKEDADI